MKRCYHELMGLWLIEDQWFTRAVSAYRAGDLKPQMQGLDEDDEGFVFERGPNGMLVVPIRGQLTKGRSSFGGTSSIEVRRVIRQAATDDSVSGVLLMIDSPGGTVSGTFELAEDVRRLREVKPVRAHIEDLGASAAYWVAVMAETISINQLGEAGSIGAVAVLIDSSKAMEAQGLKVHVISTGEFKGAGTPGTEVTEKQLAVFQEQVDDVNMHFLAAVSEGRGLTGAALTHVATGRVWIAEKAKALGLVDSIMSFDDAIQSFADELKPSIEERASELSTSLEMASLELELSQSKTPR